MLHLQCFYDTEHRTSSMTMTTATTHATECLQRRQQASPALTVLALGFTAYNSMVKPSRYTRAFRGCFCLLAQTCTDVFNVYLKQINCLFILQVLVSKELMLQR
ncbi:hypothetical protein KQX54_018510 [Cotesia glomerata]|uniref:Uncharacterized protein n=1 Tax=Cotesia glomerata TaxID=32391 RepID=A0AAV7I0Q9_COTGL|nr:hypothetical protein KQX54_018510 [Cotesia glomerata]